MLQITLLRCELCLHLWAQLDIPTRSDARRSKSLRQGPAGPGALSKSLTPPHSDRGHPRVGFILGTFDWDLDDLATV